MGTEFAIIYDIAVVAVFVGMMFAGLKKGFASAVVSLAAVFVAFACAMLFSEPITNLVYENVVEKPVKDAVSSTLDETVGAITLGNLADLNYEAIEISGVPVGEITPDYKGTNKAVIDLSDVDLSGTGISNEDLTNFGIEAGFDFSSVNAKTAEFTMTDIDRYGLPQMVVAQVIAVNMQDTLLLRQITAFARNVGEAVPMFFGDMSKEIINGSIPSIRSVILIMQESSVSAREAIINGIVEPCCRIAVQTIAFAVIFIVVSIVLSLLARMLEFVNKIPIIGGINSFCGGVVGIAQGLLTVCIICLAVRMITVLTGGTVMFFNNSAINSTFLFKIFYEFDFLNFIS